MGKLIHHWFDSLREETLETLIASGLKYRGPIVAKSCGLHHLYFQSYLLVLFRASLKPFPFCGIVEDF